MRIYLGLLTTLAVVVLVIEVIAGNHLRHRDEVLQMEYAAVKACVANQAYIGSTATQTHELFFQCLGDYTDSVTDK